MAAFDSITFVAMAIAVVAIVAYRDADVGKWDAFCVAMLAAALVAMRIYASN